MILSDTSVWSIALRRRHHDRNDAEKRLYFHWHEAVRTGQACLMGPIRQEVLSGVPSTAQFQTLKSQLDVIPSLPIDDAIWELAAEYFNTCRRHGIAPAATDMTICAAAHVHGASIFTTDPDFARYSAHLPITLHTV